MEDVTFPLPSCQSSKKGEGGLQWVSETDWLNMPGGIENNQKIYGQSANGKRWEVCRFDTRAAFKQGI